MTTLRSLAGAFALATLLLTLASPDAAAQGKPAKGPPSNESFSESVDCPNCGKVLQTTEGKPPSVCPFCGAKLDVVKKADGSYTVRILETSENKWKKPLIYGGGILLVLGLIGVALKYTVFAPAPPKKKKKRRDDDDEDDRPRKKKRAAAEDDDEDRPRKVKKPRIVEEDED